MSVLAWSACGRVISDVLMVAPFRAAWMFHPWAAGRLGVLLPCGFSVGVFARSACCFTRPGVL